jgi:hypothetical protein
LRDLTLRWAVAVGSLVVLFFWLRHFRDSEAKSAAILPPRPDSCLLSNKRLPLQLALLPGGVPWAQRSQGGWQCGQRRKQPLLRGRTHREAHAKTLRLRMYVLCSECAFIDLADGRRPQRAVDATELVEHEAEEHAHWLKVLGIEEA